MQYEEIINKVLQEIANEIEWRINHVTWDGKPERLWLDKIPNFKLEITCS